MFELLFRFQYQTFMLSLILIVVLIFISCKNDGIVIGGDYSSGNQYIKTFYIYDYVSENDIREHASSMYPQNIGTILNYYFSHNANIPTYSLKTASSFSEAKKIIIQYSSNLKYVVSIDVFGNSQFFDCSIDTAINHCSS